MASSIRLAPGSLHLLQSGNFKGVMQGSPVKCELILRPDDQNAVLLIVFNGRWELGMYVYHA